MVGGSTAALTPTISRVADALDVRRRGGGGTVDGALDVALGVALGVALDRFGAALALASARTAASDAGTFSVWPHCSQRNVVDGTSPSSRCFAPHAGHSSAFAIRRPRTLVRQR